MKVFLDIDGVMVHANPHRKVEMENDGFYRFKTEAVNAFNTIKRAEIILSTSHRHRFSKDEWETILRERGVKFIKISIIETKTSIHLSRKDEIEMWIESHHMKYQDLIIIDDDKSLNDLKRALKDRVVFTSSYIGLKDDEDIKRILLSSKRHE